MNNRINKTVFRNTLLGLIFMGITSPDIAAQEDTTAIENAYISSLHLLSKPMEDSVILRWAPDKPGGWRKCNEAGYNIDRVEVNEDTSYNPQDFIRLNDEPIQPLPLEEWEDIVGTDVEDPYAGVAAQMLYGDNSLQGLNWLEKAQQFENQWSFALFAADLSPDAADASGLRYVDRTVEPGKIYIYRVSSPVDPNEYLIIPGLNVVNMEESRPTPVPEIKELVELENAIRIKWDRYRHEKYFTAYHIERSEEQDGPFSRLTDQPYIHPISGNTSAAREDMVYLDSLNRNYKRYYYRIIGITPFGEVSEPSNIVSGMGRDLTPPPAPSNVKAEALNNHTIQLTWEMKETPPDLAGFLVGRSHESEKGFKPLTEDPLPAGVRKYIDENAYEHVDNFYVIAALDTAGNGQVSLSTFGNILDSIPPAPPQNLTGTIDTAGVVHLSWDMGDEPDLYGYRVYYANSPDHEFSQVTPGTWHDNEFTDTVTLRTLTEEIYYKVMAVDKAPNYSEYSEVLKLKRPDIIPPVQPVFKDYRISEDGIRLEWLPSSSSDVSRHFLYRKTDTTVWEMIYTADSASRDHFYLDEEVQPEVTYQYTLEAMDDDSLLSGKVYPLRLKMIDFEIKPSIRQFFASKDTDQGTVNLNWEYPYEGIHRYVLYKSTGGSGFFTYKQFDTTVRNFSDNHVKPDTSYRYAIRVIYEDGKKSPFGKIVEVEF